MNKFNLQTLKKSTKGITLVALVVTIIILLILAGISINMLTGNNGIINKASEAKIETEKSDEKEQISMATTTAQITDTGYGELTQESLQNSINSQFGNGKATVTDNGDGTFTVTMNDTAGRSYTIENSGEITEGSYDKWDGASATEPTQMSSTEIHISKASELKWLANQVNGGNPFEGYTIYLENNIDLCGRENDSNWESSENEKYKWVPIGKSASNLLKSTFDGKNYVIKGMYVNDSTNFNGLFGISYTVKNLIIKNSYISGGSYTGGISGILLSGNIENCKNINTICKLNNENGKAIGGIAGFVYPNTNVITCYNFGNITGVQRTGGVVGNASQYSTISNCYNIAEITGTGSHTGGVVGITFGILENVYNTGTVTGNGEKTGGIVGSLSTLDTDTSIKGTLSNSYNIGKVTDIGEYVGGITGSNEGTVENCYSLDGTNQNGVGYTDEDTLKNEFAIKTSTEMKTQNFIDLLGNDKWKLKADKNNGYPILSWE